jgi:hypothetical protein
MGHCGGTDPYCQQGCSPTCANYTYTTGIETISACKDPSGDIQPRVGQRAVQEAMRKVQEGPARIKTQEVLSQHQGWAGERTPTTFEKSKIGGISMVAPKSFAGNVGDGEQSFNNTNLAQQNVMGSTPHTAPGNVVPDEDEDTEFEVDEQQKSRWTGTPRRPPGPVPRRGSWRPPT